jgi:putative sterol carrier protein
MPDDIDLSRISAEDFARLVHGADDEQILEAIHDVGTAPTLDRIFQGMQERFRPDRAGGEDAVIQFVVLDEGEEHPYVVTIRDGTCGIRRVQTEDPRVTLRSDLLTFVKLTAGKSSGASLFMRGKLKISGDLMFAPRIMGFFDVPKP